MFKRVIEDFVCEYCGENVMGDGYTNHCPKCLWSKHVDVNPGDRAETCRAMMEPKKVEVEHGAQILIHQCQLCKKEKRVKVLPKDNQDVLNKIY